MRSLTSEGAIVAMEAKTNQRSGSSVPVDTFYIYIFSSSTVTEIQRRVTGARVC